MRGKSNTSMNQIRDILISPDSFWKKSSLESRLRFQSVVFPQGIEYSKGEFRTAPIAMIFNVLGDKNNVLSNKAPVARLELATG